MSDEVSISEVEINLEQRSIAAHVVAPSGPSDRGVVFLHGLYSSQLGYLPRAEALARETSATCLTFDLSGHGQSSGDLDFVTPRMHIDEAIAAARFLTRHMDLSIPRLGVCGASYGGSIAGIILGQVAVDRLALRAPSIMSDADIDRPVNDRTREPDLVATRLFGCMKRYAPPTLLVQSEFDEEIPESTIDDYARTLDRHERKLLAGASHALMQPEWDREFISLLVRWFGVGWSEDWEADSFQ